MTFKLYTDGNSFPRAKRSGFGGSIQDPSGEIILEFTEQVRDPQYIHSFELLGIIRGLKLALEHGVKDIISYCDDKNVNKRMNQIFQDGIQSIEIFKKPELYHQIIELSKKFNSIEFQYIPREFNKRADHLSRCYAKTMENTWLKQYQHDLDTSAINLSRNQEPKRKAFFSHPNIVRIINKSNPFLVSQQRNKMARSALRNQDRNQYNYIFVEYFSNKNGISLVYSLFDYQQKCLTSKTVTSPTLEKTQLIDFFHQNLISFIQTVVQDFPNVTNIWINSNNDNIMKYTEQFEKIPSKNWKVFTELFACMHLFNKVVFHILPFAPTYKLCPPKITPFEKLPEQEKWNIMTTEYLNMENSRDKKRKLGQLICHLIKSKEKEGIIVSAKDVYPMILKIENKAMA